MAVVQLAESGVGVFGHGDEHACGGQVLRRKADEGSDLSTGQAGSCGGVFGWHRGLEENAPAAAAGAWTVQVSQRGGRC